MTAKLRTASVELGIESDRFEDTPHPRQNFAFFGHDAQEQAVFDLYRSGQLPHACLIAGPAGVGKATLAWRLARFLLANPDPTKQAWPETGRLEVPRDDPVVRQVVALTHPDLILLRRNCNQKDNKPSSEIRIDDVRRAARVLRSSAGRDGFRICILDSADDLNKESANALLKIIEEPPPNVIFFLVAHKPDSILPTIRSRCRKLALKPLAATAIFDILGILGAPWSDLSETERRAASAAARGSIHDAIRHLDRRDSIIGSALDDVLRDLPRIDWHRVHALADRIALPEAAPDFDALLVRALDWLDSEIRRESAVEEPTRFERTFAYAVVFETAARLAWQTTTFNLDRRSAILELFAELAAVARGNASGH